MLFTLFLFIIFLMLKENLKGIKVTNFTLKSSKHLLPKLAVKFEKLLLTKIQETKNVIIILRVRLTVVLKCVSILYNT